MLKKIALFAIMLGIVSSTSGQNAENGLVIAHQKDYRPYCHIDSTGASAGLLVDWWKLWASKVDTSVTFRPGSIDDCLKWVKNGDVDAVAGVLIENQQLDSLLYGELIIRVKSTLFVRDDIHPKSIYQLEDSIGILASAPSVTMIRKKYSELNYKLYETTADLLNALADHSLAGFFYDMPSLPQESERPAQELITRYHKYLDVRDDALRPAMNADNEQLRELLVKGTSQITGEEIGILANDYKLMAVNSPPQRSRSQVALFWVGIVVLIAIFAVLFIRNRRLREAALRNAPKDWKAIIGGGESNSVEFKSSLRWDYREERANKALEYVIVKSISAFMNTDGGALIIGVDDKGGILGLENDYESVFKGNADGFLLVITNLINKHLGKAAHRLVKADIVPVDGKEVCIVRISRSNAPVFLKKGEKEEFYVRTSAASVPLGMSDCADYIRNHFG